MPRPTTRQRTTSRTSPQKSPVKKKSAPTKMATRRKSVGLQTSKVKQTAGVAAKKLLRKSKRVSLRRQSGGLSKMEVSNAQEKRRKTSTTRARRKDADKVSENVKKDASSGAVTRSKDKTVVKRKIVRTKSKNVSGTRQMTLKESFLNQTMSKRLRPRPAAKKEESAEDKSSKNKPKVPVYKSVPIEDSVKDTSEIYDFKFDRNDTLERLARKRKKRPAPKKTGVTKTKTKKKILRKWNVSSTVVGGKATTSKAPESKSGNVGVTSEEKIVKEKEEKVTEGANEFLMDENVGVEENVGKIAEERMDTEKEEEKGGSMEEKNKSDPSTSVGKPTIRSIENISNKRVTLMNSPVAENNFKPFRPTNVFNSRPSLQRKSLLENSLFNKSLSPIVRLSQNFDPGSPWRAPPLLTFSQVRNVFQSTPQNNRLEVSAGRLTRASNNPLRRLASVPARTKETTQKNNENSENIDPTKPRNVGNPKPKTSTPIRRFGTEITNLDHSVQSNSVVDQNERVVIEPESPVQMQTQTQTPVKTSVQTTTETLVQSPIQTPAQSTVEVPIEIPLQTPVQTVQSVSMVTSSTQNFSKFDDSDDKENVMSNYQTPKKTSKKGMKGLKGLKKTQKVYPRSPFKNVANLENSIDKEIIEPVPGPSGLQNLKGSNDLRILRQSNLNNFLNLAEMPETTTIKTRHGIFDDMHATSVSGKPAKKVEDPAKEIQTAFGFVEDVDQDSSSERIGNNEEDKENEAKVVSSKVREPVVAPSRLSIGEIKNNLKLRNENVVVEAKRKAEDTDLKIDRAPFNLKQKVNIDIASFSDTFDMLSEADETKVESEDFPLFADLEPSHFTQPPRHSYKRKRAVRFSFSEGSDAEEDELPQHNVKRKKVGRLNKADQKRLREWIDNVNQTFEEIDQHDLVVE